MVCRKVEEAHLAGQEIALCFGYPIWSPCLSLVPHFLPAGFGQSGVTRLASQGLDFRAISDSEARIAQSRKNILQAFLGLPGKGYVDTISGGACCGSCCCSFTVCWKLKAIKHKRSRNICWEFVNYVQGSWTAWWAKASKAPSLASKVAVTRSCPIYIYITTRL